MELIKISERVSYIPNVTNIGVIKAGNSVILIDSGIDDDIAKKILKCLASSRLVPTDIINTHSHADHIGGNAYIKEKTGARIYATKIEKGIIQYPYFEPFYLFSGADPIKDMKNKYLMAKPSLVDFEINKGDEVLTIDGLELNIIDFPGHSLNQIGIAFEDILFCADSVFSEDVIVRHKIPFCIDVGAQKSTLEELKGYRYAKYVPSHGAPTENITLAAEAYLQIISKVEEFSLNFLGQRKTLTEYLKDLCDYFLIDIKAVGQYYLMNTIAKAYLSYLNNQGKIKYILEGNMLFWEKT